MEVIILVISICVLLGIISIGLMIYTYNQDDYYRPDINTEYSLFRGKRNGRTMIVNTGDDEEVLDISNPEAVLDYPDGDYVGYIINGLFYVVGAYDEEDNDEVVLCYAVILDELF